MTKEEILKHYFGYTQFREGQEEVIASILAGNNTIAVLPTGAGKSVCYQIPALMGKGFSIVISPLIALMKDQVDNLNKKEKFAAFINSTMDYFESEQVFNELRDGKIKLLYIAPEKLETTNFADRIKNLSPDYLFVDEAHCISEWGHNFRPSFRRIPEFCEYTGIEKVSAFTATATPEVRQDIIEQLGFVNPGVFVRGFERDNLVLNVIRTGEKKEHTLELLSGEAKPAIVYCSTRKKAESLTDYLKIQGVNCECYHAGLNSSLRKMIQDDFIKNRIEVIVATNAFGMGIDKPDIRAVIHFNMPGSIENYYQEIGRAGRDGKQSWVTLLFEERDISIQNYFIENSNPSRDEICAVYDLLCDFHRITVGSKNDKPLEITGDLLKLLKQREVSATILDSTLKVLEADEFISIDNSRTKNQKLRFLLDSRELKEYIKKIVAKDLKTFIVELIREYGNNIILNNVVFDINKLVTRTGFTENQIRDYITRLESTGVLDVTRPTLNRKFSLVKPRLESKYLDPDLSAIQEHTNRLKKKLDLMTSFVYHEGCKTAFILKYFGEDRRGYKCGHCSSCTGVATEKSSEYVAGRILDTIHQSRSNITRRELVSILRGTSGKEYYRRLNSFNTCRHFSREQIEKTLFDLEREQKVINVKDLLKIGEAGKALIAEGDISDDNKEIGDSSDYDNKLELYTKLKEVRKSVARRFNQQPKMVCSDIILQKLIELKPQNRKEIMEVPGFSVKIFNKVGDEFLEILKGSAIELTETEIPMKVKIPDSIKGTYELLQKGYGLKDIANLSKQPETIISLQIETILEYDSEVSVDHLFYENEYEIILDAIRQGNDSLRDLKESLPDSINFAKLRIALAKYKAT